MSEGKQVEELAARCHLIHKRGPGGPGWLEISEEQRQEHRQQARAILADLSIASRQEVEKLLGKARAKGDDAADASEDRDPVQQLRNICNVATRALAANQEPNQDKEEKSSGVEEGLRRELARLDARAERAVALALAGHEDDGLILVRANSPEIREQARAILDSVRPPADPPPSRDGWTAPDVPIPTEAVDLGNIPSATLPQPQLSDDREELERIARELDDEELKAPNYARIEAVMAFLRKFASQPEQLWKPANEDETYVPAVVDRQGQPRFPQQHGDVEEDAR